MNPPASPDSPLEPWARLDLHWESEATRHCDSHFVPVAHLSQDMAHPLIRDAASELAKGSDVRLRLDPGVAVPAWHEDQRIFIAPSHFNGARLGPLFGTPRLGRFYPGKVIATRSPIDPIRPARCIARDSDRIGFDLNHPLAEIASRLDISLEDIPTPPNWHTGPARDPLGMLLENGPGMQARWRRLATDFWSDTPFARQDPHPDPGFYRQPRFVDHLDASAIARARSQYGHLIQPASRILDLMSSWHSHLPENIDARQVIGVGLNADELAANPILDQALVHDLNANPALPFADASFDAVICSLSIEYLANPRAVFRDIARLLRPGGVFITTFSNRWFPPKVIRLWPALHEFERPGLVLEYFLDSGLYRDLTSSSLRGLPRPRDDRHADRLSLADPLHAVWGYRV